ncbi:hypothetical protein AB3X91_14805 [Paraburkholderia sp. BR14263]|uniref:hypothetical protein n=1 Tax=unclassified Paraburkholderia TaxID=2615204 RepID=UPI0034CE2658
MQAFPDITNERELRVLHALNSHASISREGLDRVSGASNSPEIVRRLRKKGVTIFCEKVAGLDRDGHPVKYGTYSLSDASRCAFSAWIEDVKVAAPSPCDGGPQ